MPRNKKILPGGRYIHPVRAHLAHVRAHPYHYAWTGSDAGNPEIRVLAAQQTGAILDKLDSHEARRFIIDTDSWQAWLKVDHEMLDEEGNYIGSTTGGGARLAFPSMWLEFSETFDPFGKEPPAAHGEVVTGESVVLGFYIEASPIEFGSGAPTAAVTMFQTSLAEDGETMRQIQDTSFLMLLADRVPAMSKSTLDEANKMWPTDQSVMDMVDIEDHPPDHVDHNMFVTPRGLDTEGAGWYERLIQMSGFLVASLIDYTTQRSTVFVNLDPAPTRQQRRANERATEKSQHVPRPFHLVEVLPSRIEEERSDEEQRKLAYQTDVRGHYRRETYRRLPMRVLKDGTVRLARLTSVKSSWVHPHTKGPKDAPYIPSTYVVEN